MCGLSGILFDGSINDYDKQQKINEFFICHKSIEHRGPDRTISYDLGLPINISLAFNRLSIIDLSVKGDQPFIFSDGNRTVYVMCNGELYNHKELYDFFELDEPNSKSDCEVIIQFYKKYGFSKMHEFCNKLRAEFSCVIIDINMSNGDYTAIFSTDKFSVRPLFIGKTDKYLSFSSELSGIVGYKSSDIIVERFKPRNYAIIKKENGKLGEMEYYEYWSMRNIQIDFSRTREQCIRELNIKKINAVKRKLVSNRDVGFFLSGGVDSSIVCAIAQSLQQSGSKIRTFSIGLTDSPDLKYAKIVADHICSDHTEFIVTEEECLNEFPELFKCIATFDTTTSRASLMQFLLTKKIRQTTNIKVLLNGDFSDEEFGSYLYFFRAPDNMSFHLECIRLLEEIHLFDGLRTDRTVSWFGIEGRSSFDDDELIEYVLSCPPEFRKPYNGMEKPLLREAFKEYLPNTVLFRTKCAFSDGCSENTRSWFEIIQEYTEKIYTDDELQQKSKEYTHMPPKTKEDLWYREEFCKNFGNNVTVSNTIPHKWMPNSNWFEYEVTDPSARILKIKNDA